MPLVLQLKSLIVSFIFGIILAYLIKIFYKFLFNTNGFSKIFTNLLFVSFIYFSYFFLLYKISYAVYHIYFLFSIILGYLSGYFLIKKNKWQFIVKL